MAKYLDEDSDVKPEQLGVDMQVDRSHMPVEQFNNLVIQQKSPTRVIQDEEDVTRSAVVGLNSGSQMRQSQQNYQQKSQFQQIKQTRKIVAQPPIKFEPETPENYYQWIFSGSVILGSIVQIASLICGLAASTPLEYRQLWFAVCFSLLSFVIILVQFPIESMQKGFETSFRLLVRKPGQISLQCLIAVLYDYNFTTDVKAIGSYISLAGAACCIAEWIYWGFLQWQKTKK